MIDNGHYPAFGHIVSAILWRSHIWGVRLTPLSVGFLLWAALVGSFLRWGLCSMHMSLHSLAQQATAALPQTIFDLRQLARWLLKH